MLTSKISQITPIVCFNFQQLYLFICKNYSVPHICYVAWSSSHYRLGKKRRKVSPIFRERKGNYSVKMGKSTVSCLKIITCGSDSVGHDDLQNTETKDSPDRHGWSFRKRSARHRVLSSTVISEAASSANKESPESTPLNFQVQPNLTVPEKTSVIQWAGEKTELSAAPNSMFPVNTCAKEDDSRGDANLDESDIIVIQAAIRRCLAQRVLLKQKNIIKLQAVVRGHLVRRHAVGALRCVQAIVKMQTLVRARQARCRLLQESGDQDKQSGSSGKGNHDSMLLKSKREAKPNGAYTYISIEKLLSNRFAIQLMESTPRTKSINIKCEPSKSDSSWKWLERWMSVSAVSIEEPQESESAVEQHKEETLGLSDGSVDVLVPSECYSESTEVKSGMGASPEASEDDDNLITYDANNLDLQACESISPLSNNPKLQNIDASNSKNDVTEPAPTEIEEIDLILKAEAKSLLDKKETGNEGDAPDLRKISVEQPETEAKRFSRKASNPAFIAAHSKFEELTSDAASAKLTTSSHDDPGVESNLDKVSLSIDQPFRSQEIGLAKNSISNASTVQIGGSECGTELSISSTLDSPDRSEDGFNDLEQEPKLPDGTDHPRSKENLEPEADGTHSILETNPKHIKTNQLESVSSAPDECVSSVISIDSPKPEKEPKSDSNDLPPELGSEPIESVYKSSPEAALRSHTTVPDSQATPSSQVSIKSKQSRGEKSESNPRSSSADLKSRLKTNQDSPSRISLEQYQKEHKTGKRRSSFGSAKPDQADHEPRDSNSSNSLPSYMQATESARAKAITNGSPRSSPDVQDKDVYIKKRQSLPGTNGKQESPQVQRALSQAQQNAKGNGSHSPQERQWRR